MLYKMKTLVLIFILSATTALTQNPRKAPEHYCNVKSPIDSTVFNFTNIQDHTSDSIISLNDFHHLRIHFCRPLKDPCNGKQGYSVCLHDHDKEIGVGKEPPKVAVESAKIMFRYTGDKCNETHNYTVDIEMTCNVDIEKLSRDMDVVYNRDQCGFQMTIEISAACPKRTERLMECDLIHYTGYFNFRPLINHVGNYEIKLNDTLSVILNICHSLLYGNHFRECNHETMVCLVNETNPEEPSYTRLGNINDDVKFFAYLGAVFMELTSDTPCDAENPNRTTRTRIEFICQEDATNTLPEYIRGVEDTCEYRLRWVTAAACNELELLRLSRLNHQPCKVKDPLDNQVFDVSKLRTNSSVETTETHNAVYEFSVCGPLGKSHCSKNGTGVCKYINGQKIGVSKGLANTNLMWRRNQIFLNYTGGIGCGNHRRSYTTIFFNCAFFDSVLISDEDPCATIITWSTPNICSHRCATPDYKFNLINLREKSKNHHIRGETNETQYHMNICEPLLDESYTNCTYGTGICKTILDDKGKTISELNLGSQESGLKTAEDGRFYLRYVNGSVCEEDNSKNITTDITFTCDADMHAVGQIFLGLGSRFFHSDPFINFQKKIKGTPVFKNYSNCKYDFDWMTSFVCPESNERLSKDCLVEDRYQVINLTKIVRYKLFKINANESSGTFNVPIRGKLNTCSGTFICDKETWEGKVLQPKRKRAKYLVALKFANETQCKKDMFYNTMVKVWCNVWSDIAESFLLRDYECRNILDWARTKTLIEKHRPRDQDKRQNSTEVGLKTSSSMWALYWCLGVAILGALAFAGYYGYYTKGEMCKDLLRICYCRSAYRLVRRRRRGRPVPTNDVPLAQRPT